MSAVITIEYVLTFLSFCPVLSQIFINNKFVPSFVASGRSKKKKKTLALFCVDFAIGCLIMMSKETSMQ